ncbi:hypothetical protein BS78_03G298400 [Paspalum vaginatum]|nr:hypothetical protein BS78_03G298400 [Paspalum vaginatum]
MCAQQHIPNDLIGIINTPFLFHLVPGQIAKETPGHRCAATTCPSQRHRFTRPAAVLATPFPRPWSLRAPSFCHVHAHILPTSTVAKAIRMREPQPHCSTTAIDRSSRSIAHHHDSVQEVTFASMANHGAAALLIASLLVAVAVAGAEARLAVHRDARGGYVAVDVAAAPSLSCNQVHGVQVGETCFSVAQAAGLTQDQFLGFNPNINCEKVFVGQWVCLRATTA